MRLFGSIWLVLVLCAVVCSALREWTSFKSQFNKQYANKQVESFRRAIFGQNKELVHRFNVERSKTAGYRVGLNHLADKTAAELNQLRSLRLPVAVGHEALRQNTVEGEQFLKKILDSNQTVPESLDWRSTPGRVTSIKDQGQCGSGWAFSAIGALEGQEAVRVVDVNDPIRKGQLVDLSAQNLIDCSKENFGCYGGFMKSAMDLVKEEGGITDVGYYPYIAEDYGPCHFNKSQARFTDSGAVTLPEGDEDALKKVVAKFGPVAVAIDSRSDDFILYQSGIYFNKNCSHLLTDHAVLVVGYGSCPKHGDYWIVKNSWGTSWGEAGYIRIARNRDNHCGVATLATIPTFDGGSF